MIPVLFPPNAAGFTTNGLGPLNDAISCLVTEERNGLYDLELVYPVSGRGYSDITDRSIIQAIPSPYRKPQLFRVYRHTKPIDGQVTFYAHHISYDLSGIPVRPFTAGTAAEALTAIPGASVIENPFEFWTDKQTVASYDYKSPANARAVLGGVDGSILDVYGGEYEFDNHTVKLHNHRGADNGVTIRYGKNLVDLTQERNIGNVHTGVYPYWTDTEGTSMVTAEPEVVQVPGDFGFQKILIVDFSQDFEEAPTPEQLKARAERYIKSNKIGVPTVSISVNFVALDQTVEYAGLRLLEKCDLCDTVTVQFSRLGVDAKAKIIKIVTDVLRERYESVEVGDSQANFTDTVTKTEVELQKKPSRSDLESAVSSATGLITGQKGGTIHIRRTADGKPYELVITDTDSITTATDVWRWNVSGLGHSSHGYNGPYSTAITQDGRINADFILTGALNAEIIRAGIIRSKDGSSFWNLDTGELQLTAYAQKSDLDSVKNDTDKLKNELAGGVSSVKNAIGTFNADGLQIKRDGSEMKTQITDNGMRVYRNDVVMLSASSQGVDAENLHATTYLIVGKNSRFEDYNVNRTGCFWIGG